METISHWYIVKLPDDTCEIIQSPEKPQNETYWGSYTTFEEAIAKRVGLIRANKCKPK